MGGCGGGREGERESGCGGGWEGEWVRRRVGGGVGEEEGGRGSGWVGTTSKGEEAGILCLRLLVGSEISTYGLLVELSKLFDSFCLTGDLCWYSGQGCHGDL